MAPSQRRITGKQLARLLGLLAPGVPQYVALGSRIRDLLMAGQLPLAARLPAERELALALNVSRTTITAAYDRLRTDGYVESHTGAGTFLATPRARGPGGPVPHAGDGQIDLGVAAPPATLLLGEAFAAAAAEAPRYFEGTGYFPAGLPALRECIARYYQKLGVPTRADQVLVTTGAQHALSLLFNALVTPGDAVLVESPTYPHAMSAARDAGARLVPVGLNPENGWDLELIEQAVRQAAVRLAYVIADFQNPTGFLMDSGTRQAWVDAARRAGLYLIVDEVCAGIGFDESRPAPVASFDADGRVISVGGLSKIAWGGLRVGWIRAAAPLIERLTAARADLDLASPVLEQLVAVELLERSTELSRERRRFAQHRDALAEAVRKLEPAWRFKLPSGGLSLWIELDAPIGTQLATHARGYGVHLVPGSYFSPDGLLERYLRIPFVHPPSVLSDAMARIAKAHRELRQSRAEMANLPYRAVV